MMTFLANTRKLIQGKKSLVFGLTLSLLVLDVALFALLVLIGLPDSYQWNVEELWEKPSPEWINMLTVSKTITLESKSLRPIFFAQFPDHVQQSSLRFVDSTGTNLIDRVSLLGGAVKSSTKQALLIPSFDFYPSQNTFTFEYQTLAGEERQNSFIMDLVYYEDFESYQDGKSTVSFWYFGKGAQIVERGDNKAVLLDPDPLATKTKIVFLKNYTGVARISFTFIPLGAVPNLSISFSELSSFVVGDGRPDNLIFKQYLGKRLGKAEYHTCYTEIPKIESGRTYQALVERLKDDYKITLSEGNDKILTTFQCKAYINDREEKYPVISIWAYPLRSQRKLHHGAGMLIDDVRISFQ